MEKVTTSHDNGVAIETNTIPEWISACIALETISAMQRYFELPGIKEDYERWLSERHSE